MPDVLSRARKISTNHDKHARLFLLKLKLNFRLFSSRYLTYIILSPVRQSTSFLDGDSHRAQDLCHAGTGTRWKIINWPGQKMPDNMLQDRQDLPIWNAIEASNFKQALKLVDKRLSKKRTDHLEVSSRLPYFCSKKLPSSLDHTSKNTWAFLT